ncbi:FecR family protein [Dyadobacter subterraneus]|uniref:FecR domain-containing protein n=1 Tax=Dyadobacter subterraneus TaxID=2773304 RepID=A0ABR9W6Z9_9BACT|nr:FecR family protein [Dyadobacter subterraneus]MBE9461240.1 FecR domain-containing protein [Dyadobacter subterraneus]
MKAPFEIADLIFKYLNGNLSKEENKVLQDWLNEDIANQILLNELQNKDKMEEGLQFFESIDQNAAWENINQQIDSPVIHRSFWSYKKFFKYAAAILITGIVGYAFLHKKGNQTATIAKTKKPQILKNDVLPGGNKATLTLGDGSVITLEDMENGTFKKENGVKISKKEGQLVYEILPTENSSIVTYNTINTPTGGQYEISLPDGSKVWLNSKSSLHFPTAFSGKERKVELTGEGYFEVSKNKEKPFVVEAGKTHVEVLGTHFNIMAYDNEAVSKTTLLEGSVKVGNGENKKLLNPGQQAVIGSQIRVRTADTDEAVAWKEGYFQFDNEDLTTIMRQLKRWYDVDVVNEQQIPNKHFTAMISRNTTLSKVLKMLEMSGELKFEIEDKKVTIREK